ncbi:YihY/virulence factor BrkB family protein [Glutamicibacter sp.]|uniref:YihY/virulence factor BrkB family protein n=1 Tax=Glutamicibacter sp. TaxID=1931995 RepID=UPI0028BEC0C6|nr:YihY/virulence factor BrkB family protein [Glutamicibacter sp.]
MPTSKRLTKERLKEDFVCFPRATREFFRNDGLDTAASLTYYMVLALFPALLAFISILTFAGASESATDWLMGVLELALSPNGEQLNAESQQLLDTAEQVLDTLAANAAGTTLAITVGSIGALWSTSAYVSAFGRAMNRLFGVREGRPQWKRRPQMFLITLAIMILAIVSATLFIVTGTIAQGLGNILGMGDSFVIIWNLVKPLAFLVIFLLVLALLYYYTPNVKRPKFQWFSPGSITALIALGLATIGFSFYITHFASYSATYGTIGSLIVLVLAGWIGNIALIAGALVDIEFIRLKQLRTGLPSAEIVHLPLRDSAIIAKKNLSNYKDLVEAQEIRLHHGGDPLQDMTIDPHGKVKRKTKLSSIALASLVTWAITRRSYRKQLRRRPEENN